MTQTTYPQNPATRTQNPDHSSGYYLLAIPFLALIVIWMFVWILKVDTNPADCTIGSGKTHPVVVMPDDTINGIIAREIKGGVTANKGEVLVSLGYMPENAGIAGIDPKADGRLQIGALLTVPNRCG